MPLEFHGLTFRNPTFDGPGDRRVLATVIGELQRMLSTKMEISQAINAYREYRCRDGHERRVLEDLRQLIQHRLSLDHQISYSGWLWAKHQINAAKDPEMYLRSQRSWLEAIAEEFRA